MIQQENHKGFSQLLEEWEKHSAEHADLETLDIAVHASDLVKLKALSQLYNLPVRELTASLMMQALEALEAEMPYIPGQKVIRIEEGDEIYEDIGPMPRYLEAQKQVMKQQK